MDLPRTVFELLVAALVVWRVSTTLAVARVFEPMRAWARPDRDGAIPAWRRTPRQQRVRQWIYELLSCQLCLSHYVALAYLCFWRVDLVHTGGRLVNFLVTWMTVVALSSILARMCQKREPVIPEAIAIPLEDYLKDRAQSTDSSLRNEHLREGAKTRQR